METTGRPGSSLHWRSGGGVSFRWPAVYGRRSWPVNVIFTSAVGRWPRNGRWGITLIGCGSLNSAWLGAAAAATVDGYD